MNITSRRKLQKWRMSQSKSLSESSHLRKSFAKEAPKSKFLLFNSGLKRMRSHFFQKLSRRIDIGTCEKRRLKPVTCSPWLTSSISQTKRPQKVLTSRPFNQSLETPESKNLKKTNQPLELMAKTPSNLQAARKHWRSRIMSSTPQRQSPQSTPIWTTCPVTTTSKTVDSILRAGVLRACYSCWGVIMT